MWRKNKEIEKLNKKVRRLERKVKEIENLLIVVEVDDDYIG